MKKKRKILGIAGGLLFIAFVAMNFTVSRSYQGDESVAQLTLTELAAKAQNGDETANCTADDPGECAVSCGPNGPCCVGNSPNCVKNSHYSIRCDDKTLFCT